MKKQDIENNSKNYWQYIIPLLIIIITMVVFNPLTDNGILHGWDDTEYFTDKNIQDFNLGEIFSNYHLGMYQPLSVVTMAMNYGSAGENAGAYHATNLFFHAINILLVWIFILLLTRKRIVAGIVTALFAIHPMNVEPIAWISARSTLVFTAFYIGGLIAYIRYLDNKKNVNYLLTIVLALMAMFSKSLAISFPIAMLIIDYYKNRKSGKLIWMEKLPFLVFAVIFGIITVDAARSFGHISAMQYEYSFINHIFILCHTLDFYLLKFFVPLELSSIYAYPETVNGLLPWIYYLSAIIPLGLLFLIYKFWSRKKHLIAGLLFFFFTVAPVLPLFWSRVFVAADRYVYLAFIGLFLVIGLLSEKLLRKDASINKNLRYSFAGFLLIAWITLTIASTSQFKYWSSAESLLARAVTLSESGPAKTLSYFYLGNARQNIAETKYRNGQAANDEGMVRNSFTYYRMAIQDYDSVLKYNPDYMMAYSNRGMIYGTLLSYDESYWQKALDDFDNAIFLQPDYADNYYNKAWLLLISGNKEEACNLWHKADELGSNVAQQAIQQNCEGTNMKK